MTERMTKIFFSDQMHRLEACLRQTMTESQKEEYYHALKKCDEELFRYAVDIVMQTHDTYAFPRIPALLRAYDEAQAGLSTGTPDDYAALGNCELCNRDGLKVVEKEDGRRVVTPCDCVRGQRRRSMWERRGIAKILRQQNLEIRMSHQMEAERMAHHIETERMAQDWKDRATGEAEGSDDIPF